ncbi:MAG TPA: hypothetical protein VIU38_06545, partial [Anaerolineales bacterium]
MDIHLVPLGWLPFLVIPVMALVNGQDEGEGGDEAQTRARDSQVGWLRSIGDRQALFQVMDSHRQLTQGLDAAEALTELGDVRGLDHLIDMLDSRSSYLRDEAASILRHLNHPRGLRALKEHPAATAAPDSNATREQLFDDLNGRDTDELIGLWHHHDESRWSSRALQVLEGVLTDRLGAPPPTDEVTGDPDYQAIDEHVSPRIQELWRLGDEDGLKAIFETESDTYALMEAAEALAALGDSEALDFLAFTLDEPDEKVSDEAAQILDWLNLPRGNAALEDRGFEFEPPPDNLNTRTEPVIAQHTPQPSPRSSTLQAPPISGMAMTPHAAIRPAWQQSPSLPPVSAGILFSGAAGGIVGFLGFRLLLHVLGLELLP